MPFIKKYTSTGSVEFGRWETHDCAFFCRDKKGNPIKFISLSWEELKTVHELCGEVLTKHYEKLAEPWDPIRNAMQIGAKIPIESGQSDRRVKLIEARIEKAVRVLTGVEP